MISLAAVEAATVEILCSRRLWSHRKKRRSQRCTKYKRSELLPVNQISLSTPWKYMLANGGEEYFLVTFSVTKYLLLTTTLPCFEYEMKSFKFGSPYVTLFKLLVDTLLLKLLTCLQNRCTLLEVVCRSFSVPFFGLVPTSMSVWMDYTLQFMTKW